MNTISYEPYRVPSWILDVPYLTLADRDWLRTSARHHANLMLCYLYLAHLESRWVADVYHEARAAASYALDVIGRE